MTHPLSAELRQLADAPHWCSKDVRDDALRRAAHVLDMLWVQFDGYKAVKAERERYREALEWYANPKRPWDHTIAEKALREHDK